MKKLLLGILVVYLSGVAYLGINVSEDWGQIVSWPLDVLTYIYTIIL